MYRQEKRNAENELVSEGGWKPIGKGQLRLMASEGAHFIEFRPEVSDSKTVGDCNDPTDEMQGKTRFGRPVLSALLRADTKADVTRKSVQANLWSTDAAGSAVFARYNIPLGSEEVAAKFAAAVMANRPAA